MSNENIPFVPGILNAIRIRDWTDLRKHGFDYLTGEACSLGIRVLVDLNAKAARIWRELIGLPHDSPLARSWNGGNGNNASVASAMIPREMLVPIAIATIASAQWTVIVVETNDTVTGLEGDPVRIDDWLKYHGEVGLIARVVRDKRHKSAQPARGMDNVHAMTDSTHGERANDPALPEALDRGRSIALSAGDTVKVADAATPAKVVMVPREIKLAELYSKPDPTSSRMAYVLVADLVWPNGYCEHIYYLINDDGTYVTFKDKNRWTSFLDDARLIKGWANLAWMRDESEDTTVLDGVVTLRANGIAVKAVVPVSETNAEPSGLEYPCTIWCAQDKLTDERSYVVEVHEGRDPLFFMIDSHRQTRPLINFDEADVDMEDYRTVDAIARMVAICNVRSGFLMLDGTATLLRNRLIKPTADA